MRSGSCSSNNNSGSRRSFISNSYKIITGIFSNYLFWEKKVIYKKLMITCNDFRQWLTMFVSTADIHSWQTKCWIEKSECCILCVNLSPRRVESQGRDDPPLVSCLLYKPEKHKQQTLQCQPRIYNDVFVTSDILLYRISSGNLSRTVLFTVKKYKCCEGIHLLILLFERANDTWRHIAILWKIHKTLFLQTVMK